MEKEEEEREEGIKEKKGKKTTELTDRYACKQFRLIWSTTNIGIYKPISTTPSTPGI